MKQRKLIKKFRKSQENIMSIKNVCKLKRNIMKIKHYQNKKECNKIRILNKMEKNSNKNNNKNNNNNQKKLLKID